MDSGVTYTLEECINYIGLGRFQWRLITILGFCSMADAVEMMLLAILGPALTCYWTDVTEIQIASLTTVKNLFCIWNLLIFLFEGCFCRYDDWSIFIWYYS
jgi:hypothetical protein